MKNLFIGFLHIINVYCSSFYTLDSNNLTMAHDISYSNNNEYLNLTQLKEDDNLSDTQMLSITTSYTNNIDDHNFPSPYMDTSRDSSDQSNSNNLILDKNNFFVKTLTDLITFSMLYRITIVKLLIYFSKKHYMCESVGIENVIYREKYNSLDELIKLGLDFYEKNEMIYYNTIVFSNMKSCTSNSEQNHSNTPLDKNDNITLRNTQLYPPFHFNAKFRDLFGNIKDSLLYNKVFITLLSYFYKLAAYYNEHLKLMCQGLFAYPPALADTRTFCYCLTNKKNQLSPNFIVYWVFDWLIYLLTYKKRVPLLITFIDDLNPTGKSTRFLILLFCALHYNEISDQIKQDTTFLINWATKFSYLILKDRAIYNYFKDFVTSLTNCSYKTFPDLTFEPTQHNLLELTSQPNYSEVNNAVVDFVLFAHQLINDALQATIAGY